MMDFVDEAGSLHRIGRKTLLIFIDETGSESLNDPLYPIFGVGGCMLPLSIYSSNIIKPWIFLKNKEFGGEKTPMHATDLVKRRLLKSQLDILNKFFITCAFGRFSVIISNKVILNTTEDLSHFVVRSLYESIKSIAINTEFDDIVFFFEEREGADIFFGFFERYKLEKNGVDVSIRKFKIQKSKNEPGLEVADFIVHTAGTCVRDRLSGKRTKEKERQDFKSVFMAGDQRLSSFKEITEINVVAPFVPSAQETK